MTHPVVRLEIEPPWARITLDRRHVLNAMDLALVTELERAVATATAGRDVRVIVLQGAGRAFCAGLDLDMLAERGMPAGFYERQERALRRLELADQVTIAVLHSHCLGGGVQMAIACDVRIAYPDALLGLPAVNEGLPPGLAPYRLPRLIGLGPARRLVLSGEVIGADEAQGLGLVDHVLSGDATRELADLLQRYAAAPAMAVAASKLLSRDAHETSYDDALATSHALLARCLASPDVAAAREARRARATQVGA